MMRTTLLATALASTMALTVAAQDTKPITQESKSMIQDTRPLAPLVNPPQTTVPKATQASAATILSDVEAKNWIDRPVYSSEGDKVGEVAVIQRDVTNTVLGMHADMGGFLGMMQTRVNLLPTQFKLEVDRVVLNLTTAQFKALPKVRS